MAIDFKTSINGVAQYFSFVEIAEKKQGDAKWRRVIRPSFLAIITLFIIFVLILCNVAVNDPYSGSTTVWKTAVFGSHRQNCTDTDTDTDFYGSSRHVKRNEAASQRSLHAGTETLPRGIVESTTDLELRHLWQVPDKAAKPPENLLAMAVGIKQKNNVDRIIQKFPADNFTVMLFHYDGKVDNWTDLTWSARAIHVMALNQTKWWFAKRFLHPDVVQQYNYMFLWDEDLGVEHFHASRYLGVMEDEGLEISQPALHRNSSEVHHRLTLWNPKVRAHRRIYSYTGRSQCSAQSTGPPCTGWVEMMAPVFSRAAWRCTWHMIQNDLVHAWGLDYKLGYCAQGIRSEKVGVIDAEFVVHEGIPSLGGPRKQTAQAPLVFKDQDFFPQQGQPPAGSTEVDTRGEIRRRAGQELTDFARRWKRAASNDPEWKDPYKQPVLNSIEVAPEQPAVSKEEMRPVPVKTKKKLKAKLSTESSAYRDSVDSTSQT